MYCSAYQLALSRSIFISAARTFPSRFFDVNTPSLLLLTFSWRTTIFQIWHQRSKSNIRSYSHVRRSQCLFSLDFSPLSSTSRFWFMWAFWQRSLGTSSAPKCWRGVPWVRWCNGPTSSQPSMCWDTTSRSRFLSKSSTGKFRPNLFLSDPVILEKYCSQYTVARPRAVMHGASVKGSSFISPEFEQLAICFSSFCCMGILGCWYWTLCIQNHQKWCVDQLQRGCPLHCVWAPLATLR